MRGFYKSISNVHFTPGSKNANDVVRQGASKRNRKLTSALAQTLVFGWLERYQQLVSRHP